MATMKTTEGQHRMSTLQNVHGGSLSANIGGAFADALGPHQERQREQQKQTELETLIRGSLGIEGPAPTPSNKGNGLLGRLAPGIAQAVTQLRGNVQGEAKLRDEANRGVTLAVELQKLPDHGARVRRLAEEGGRMVAAGEDIGRVTELSNLSPEKLDLELMRMQMIGNETIAQLPRQEAIAAVMARNPALGSSLQNRRDREIAQAQAARAAAARRAANANAPKTELGQNLAKVRDDIANGNISQEIGDQMIANLRSGAAADPNIGSQLEIDQARADLAQTALENAGLEAELNAPPEPNKVEETEGLLRSAGIEPGTDQWNQAVNAAAGVDADAAADAENRRLRNEQLQLQNDALAAKAAAPPPDATAPKVITQTRADGSDITLQWTPDETQPEGGTWTPLSVESGVGGTVIASPDDLTEGQAKMTLFNSMMEETQPVLSDIEAQWDPANVSDAAARSTPVLGNFFTSEKGQVYNSAAAAWAEGALRLATGAAATPEEIVRTRDTYFAKPGDTPVVIGFKSDMRDMYSRSIQKALGRNDDVETLQTPAQFARTLKGSIDPPSVDTFADFSADPLARAAAEKYGVTLEEMWAQKQKALNDE